MKIYYLFDPLCGWCYGASPILQEVNKIYPLALTPTGLFYQAGRKLDASWANHAWENDQRIAKLTGQIFSQHYFKEVLQSKGVFDSKNLLLALTVVQRTDPSKAFTVLSALQTIRYVDGLDNTNINVIEQVLVQQGLSKAVLLINQKLTETLLLERIQFGQQLAQQVDIQGVPQLIVEKEDKLNLVPSQLLYEASEALLAYLYQF